MQDYQSTYSQEVRDLAETFCSSTTRLSAGEAREPRALPADIREEALAHSIDIGVLSQAIAAYSQIEALAEAAFRKR